MKQPPPELFSPERPVRSDFARQGGGLSYATRRRITLAVIFFIVIGGGSWLWGRFTSSAPGVVPTIKAEGAYKQRPEQSGGIDIPHQDVQVYHEIDGSAVKDSGKPVIEHMLPPPEEPKESASIAPKVVENSAVPELEKLTSGPAVTTTVSNPVPAIVAPIVAPPAPVAVSLSAAPPAPLAAPQPNVTATKPTVAAKATALVQLAAFPDKHEAEIKAKQLQAKYAATLGSAKLRIVRANLSKGVFYRVQSQSLPEDQAKSICATLKNKNAGCILVTP